MTRLLLAVVLLLASCSRPRDGFVVVDLWGSIVLRTDDEEEAWRLAAQLTSMGRVLASKPQYFVLKGVPAKKKPPEDARAPHRW